MNPPLSRSLLMATLLFVSAISPVTAQDNLEPLTQTNSLKQQVRISQDGMFIVYVGDQVVDNNCQALAPASQEVFLLDVAGEEVRPLTENDVADTAPSISADGGIIAFARDVGAGLFSLFIFDTLVDEERLINTQLQTDSATIGIGRPMISGDGNRIVYEQEGDIFVVNVDGSDAPRNLTNSPQVTDQFPSITADGRHVAFSSSGNYLGTNDGDDEEIYVVSYLGTSMRQLTQNEIPDLHPMISGDGALVAFERELGGPQSDIFVVSVDSGVETNLTNSPASSEHFPAPSETGAVVAFEVRSGQEAHYAKINLDGTELATLAPADSTPLELLNVSLTQAGDRVAFSAQDEASGCRQIFLSGTPPNVAPLANGGGDQTVTVGQAVELDASASEDEDGDPLTFSWEIVSKPEGSDAALEDAAEEVATLVPDVAGEYLLNVTVDDGRGGVDSDKVHILAQEEEDGENPPPPSGEQGLAQALDVNDNGIIDDEEMMSAVTYWVLGTPVPGTDMLVGDDQILGLIEQWILGTPIEEPPQA